MNDDYENNKGMNKIPMIFESTKIDSNTSLRKSDAENQMATQKNLKETPKTETENKIQFLGKIQKVDFDDKNFLFNISLGDNDRKLLESTKSDKGWNNLVLKKSKEKGNWYLAVSTFVPKAK